MLWSPKKIVQSWRDRTADTGAPWPTMLSRNRNSDPATIFRRAQRNDMQAPDADCPRELGERGSDSGVEAGVGGRCFCPFNHEASKSPTLFSLFSNPAPPCAEPRDGDSCHASRHCASHGLDDVLVIFLASPAASCVVAVRNSGLSMRHIRSRERWMNITVPDFRPAAPAGRRSARYCLHRRRDCDVVGADHEGDGRPGRNSEMEVLELEHLVKARWLSQQHVQ